MWPGLCPTSVTYEWDSHEKSPMVTFYRARALGMHAAANGGAGCGDSAAPEPLPGRDEHVGYFTA